MIKKKVMNIQIDIGGNLFWTTVFVLFTILIIWGFR